MYAWSPSETRHFARPRHSGTLGVAAYGTYPELIAAPDVDAVLIADARSVNEEVILFAARAGKHICEKSLAVNTAKCYRLIDEAQQYGVKMVCGQVTRLYPVCPRAAQMARSGMLGELAAVNGADLHHRDHANCRGRPRRWAHCCIRQVCTPQTICCLYEDAPLQERGRRPGAGVSTG